MKAFGTKTLLPSSLRGEVPDPGHACELWYHHMYLLAQARSQHVVVDDDANATTIHVTL
jgi:hypothetical protein